MTFPLGSLRPAGADSSLPTRESKAANSRRRAADEPEPDPSQRTSDWQRQSLVLAGGVAWLLVLIALLSHSASDAAFSTSGAGAPVHNRAGVLGAWLSDLALFGFGFSVWWAMALALHRWLRALAQLLRAEDSPVGLPEVGSLWPDWTMAAGLAMLMAASAALEWSRLYRWESLLPGAHSGGVLGYLLGPASMNLLGFAGSGVLWIALLLAGLSLAFQFSWLNVADAIGERPAEHREDAGHGFDPAIDVREDFLAAAFRIAVCVFALIAEIDIKLRCADGNDVVAALGTSKPTPHLANLGHGKDLLLDDIGDPVHLFKRGTRRGRGGHERGLLLKLRQEVLVHARVE